MHEEQNEWLHGEAVVGLIIESKQMLHSSAESESSSVEEC